MFVCFFSLVTALFNGVSAAGEVVKQSFKGHSPPIPEWKRRRRKRKKKKETKSLRGHQVVLGLRLLFPPVKPQS